MGLDELFGIMTEQRNAPSSYLNSGIVSLEKTMHTGRRCAWLFGYGILLNFAELLRCTLASEKRKSFWVWYEKKSRLAVSGEYAEFLTTCSRTGPTASKRSGPIHDI